MSWMYNDEALLSSQLIDLASVIDDVNRLFTTNDVFHKDTSGYTVYTFGDSDSLVADGVTDDTTEFQAVLTANAGSKINGNGKTLRLTQRITLPSNTPLYNMTLYWSTDTGTQALINQNWANEAGSDTVYFEDVTFIGPSDGNPTGEEAGMTGPILKHLNELYIKNCLFTKFSGIACPIQGCIKGTIYRSWVRNNGRDGFTLWSSGDIGLSNIDIMFCGVDRSGDDMFAIQQGGSSGTSGEALTGDIVSGSATVSNISGHSFTIADIGKSIILELAGDLGWELETTILSVVNSSTIVVSSLSQRTATAANIWFNLNRTSNINIFNCYGIGQRSSSPNNLGRGILLKGVNDVLCAYNHIENTAYTGAYLSHEHQVSLLIRGKSLRIYNTVFMDCGQVAGSLDLPRYGIRTQRVDDVHCRNIKFVNTYSDNLYSLQSRYVDIETL